MKVVHVVEAFAAGIAVFVQSLTENLKDDVHIIFHGEREHVMKFADIQKYFPEENVQFVRWQSAQRNLSFKKDLTAFMELYRFLVRLKKAHEVDVVHLHSSKSGFLGRLACRLANITNVVYTPNGAPFLVSRSMLINWLYRQFEKVGSLFGGKVVCCSHSEWEAYQKIGIDAVNINNGVSVKSARAALWATPKAGARFRIVTCARIVQQKNPALFNAIASWFADFDQFEFIWVGDGEERDLLTANNIIVSGWLSPAETKALLATADVYLSTSHFEGLSFAVLEALALKKAVLLNDCIGNRDVVKRGLNGDLFRNEQEAVTKLLQYFNNPDMLRVMGEYSMQFCRKEFNVHATCALYRNLYSA